MPELPSITVYTERLRAYIVGHVLQRVRVLGVSLLQTVDPPLREVEGSEVRSVDHIGKRIVFGFDDDLFLVLHLMIAGRLRWKKPGFAIPRKRGLAGFYFEHGTLLLTEASTKKRASLHCVRGREALADFDRGGLEVLGSSLADFTAAMQGENRTLKRAMTDPRILSGIGNAYSDEILHRAKLSPLKRTRQLSDEDLATLHEATTGVLTEWIERLRAEVGDGFPDKVTAFHPQMAVHGRYREPCPVCGSPIQHIVYAENECNYCPTCQTDGRLLSDRSLARLLHEDWPRTVEELEELRGR